MKVVRKVKVVPRNVHQYLEEFHRLVAVWTGKSLQPFAVTEDETLQDVITYASSVSNNLTLPSEDTNKQNVLREVARMKQAIRKDIAANCLYFSSTTNIWSFAERKSFMILTIHYLTENFL